MLFAFQLHIDRLDFRLGFALVQVFSLIICLNIGIQCVLLQQEIAAYRRKLVIDLDLAREQYLSTAKLMYMKGCEMGIDYPPEYRSTPGFNINSPMNYCDRNSAHWNDFLSGQALGLGRPY